MAENPYQNNPTQPAVANEAAPAQPAPSSSPVQYGYASPDLGAQVGTMGYADSRPPRNKKRLLLIILGAVLVLCLLLGGLAFAFRKNSKISAIISSTSNAVDKATGKPGSSNGSSKSSGAANASNNPYSDTPSTDPTFIAQTAKTLATGDPAPVAVQFITAMKNADDAGVNKLLSPSGLKKAQLSGSSLATYCKNKGNACIGVFKAYTSGLTATVTNTSTSNGAVAKMVSYTVKSPADATGKTPMRLSIILIPAGPSWMVSDFKLGS